MIDLHTHILPKMDDGASSSDLSLEMLRMEAEQGVDTVVLTPHFYREKEDPSSFLQRRASSFYRLKDRISELSDKEKERLPELFLGAEVAWVPNMDEWSELSQLCLGDSSFLLLELPFYPWSSKMIDQIYDLMSKTGITPIIAHLECYAKLQRWSSIQEILALGIPIQLSTSVFFTIGGRRLAKQLLRHGTGFLLASDCHNTTTRPPNLGNTMAVLKKKFPFSTVLDLRQQALVIQQQLI